MMRLNAVRRGNAMDVRTPPVFKWIPFNVILLLLLYQGAVWIIRLFTALTTEDIDGRMPLHRGAIMMAGIFALEMAMILIARLLWFGLQSRRYVFRTDGIEVVKLLARVPVRRTFFTQEWIYAFGFVDNERSIRGALTFKADGDEYWLESDAEPYDAERFLEQMRAEGFVYSAAAQPEKRSRTSAHTWLG